MAGAERLMSILRCWHLLNLISAKREENFNSNGSAVPVGLMRWGGKSPPWGTRSNYILIIHFLNINQRLTVKYPISNLQEKVSDNRQRN